MITPTDYPDPRDEARRRRDADAASQQSAALTSANRDPGARADGLIDQLLAQREGVQSDSPPLQIDVLRLPDHGDRGGTYLVVRGELLLRVPPDAPPGPEHADADRSKGDKGAPLPTSRPKGAAGAPRLLPPQITRVFLSGHRMLPARTSIRTKDPNVHELARTRGEVCEETGADVDFNYVCTTGYLTKGEDYPAMSTAALAWYSPEWFENKHPVLRPINVAIIDTGINRELRTDGWLATIEEAPQNEVTLDVVPGDGVLAESAGHGTFVSGVLQQVAPRPRSWSTGRRTPTGWPPSRTSATRSSRPRATARTSSACPWPARAWPTRRRPPSHRGADRAGRAPGGAHRGQRGQQRHGRADVPRGHPRSDRRGRAARGPHPRRLVQLR